MFYIYFCYLLSVYAKMDENSSEEYDTDEGDLDDGCQDDPRGLVGLQNLGNTCYMNSALQALSNCQQLTRFVLDCPSLLKEKGLCRSYSELIKEIWDPNSSQYAVPTSIIRNIKCIYPAFRGCTQQDTQEFLRCFLEQLHDELKQKIVKSPKTSTEDLSDHQEGDQEDKNRGQGSIISDTFEFKISSSVVCSSCNSISTTEETFKDLSIPIPTRYHPYYTLNEENTSESTSSTNGWFWNWLSYFSNWFWGPQVTLKDCLSIFFGTDPLEGDNEYSCDVCTKKNRGVKYLKILELPEVLCIHFKRYESIGSSKIMTHVSFPLKGLDLAPYMSEKSMPQCTTYDLFACICHHGSALLTGHYTTYALNCYDHQWYEFDDQYVTSVQNYQVENSEAYILFYQKTNSDNRINR